MKYFLFFLLGLLVVSYGIYAVPSFHAQAANLLTYSACDSPLQYRLGSIDSRFGLSNKQVLDDIQNATNIWSSAKGKKLFALSPTATLTINFVYDQRQELDTSINQLHSQLTQNDKSLSEQIAQYEEQLASFKQRLATLNSTIDKYNQEGGAPPDVYNNLIKQQQELNQERDTLNARARELKLSTSNYNYNVSVLNNDINEFQNVLAQKPEEGLYNGGNNTITMYFADNKSELIHTLTHELGHALGMDHVKDPQAIMYAYTTSSQKVTADDVQELNFACRKQSVIIHKLQQFDLWLFKQLQSLR